MNTQDRADYQSTLREQLSQAAPAALEMLAGSAPLDPVILLAAAQAAGLLDRTTVGEPELRQLREALVEALRASDMLSQALGYLELGPGRYALEGSEPHEREETLHQLVALAALSEVGPPSVGEGVEAALCFAEGTALLEPQEAASLAPLAGWMADQLGLDDEHRVSRLLRVFEDAALAEDIALDEAALRRGMAAAAANLRRSRLAAWIDKLAQCARKLAEGLRHAEPQVAQCAADQPRSQAIPARNKLSTQDGEELFLTVHGGSVFLEWDGPPQRRPERATLEPAGVELLPETELFEEGTRLWSMGWPPAQAVEYVVLHRTGGSTRVELADR